MIVFPKKGDFKPGQYVQVKVNEATSATLRGEMK
jgi:NAD(P)H-flavin reductase